MAPSSSSGGGGGGAPADLALTLWSSASTVAVGDTVLYRIDVRVANADQTSGVSRAIVSNVLPSGVTLETTKVNRGQGCTGTTTVTCDLDFLSGSLVGVVELTVRVTAPGSLVDTASVSAPEHDPDESNNTSSVVLSVPAALTPPVQPRSPSRATAVTLRRGAQSAPRPSRVGPVAVVRTTVAVGGRATVAVTVADTRSGKRLTLQRGSALGTGTAKAATGRLTASVAGPSRLAVKALVSSRSVVRGRRYVLQVVATSPSGASTRLTIPFVG